MLQVPMPKTDAERSREYRQRKKENDNKNKIKKPPKSSTERVRDFRARRIKILDKQNENNSYNVNNNVAGEPNSDKGRLFLHVMHENGSDYDNTEAGQALTKNLIEVKLPSRNDDGEGLIIPRVKQENDSDFDDYTEAGQAFTPNIIQVKLASRIDDGAGLIIPRVKQDNDSDFDDYTGDKGTLSPHVKSPQENDSDYDNTDDASLLSPVVKLEYESDGDDNTGNDTDCVYGSGAPGPSTEKELRADIVDNRCVATYSRQDFKPSETESTDNESRRFNKVPKTAAERGREYRARKALLRQQRKQQQEQDNQAVPPEIKKLEKRKRSAEATRRWREKKRALSGLSKKQAKTAAERMREYRQRKKRERKGGQDLDSIVSILSSHVNQVAGPSTVNSTPAELQQQNSHLCAVCNRLWCKDDLSEEVTNINNINGAVICPTCKVALDEQQPADEQLDDAGLLIPIVKLEYESDGDDNTGNDTDCVYGSGAPGSSTEKELRADIVDNECVATYSRQDSKPSETESTDNESRRLKKAPKTAAERARDYRARKARLKEQLKQQQERDATAGQSEDNQVPKPPEISITDKGAISDSSEKQVKTPAESMQEYRPRIKSSDNIRRLNLAQRQRIHRMRRKDNENIDKIFKMKEALKEYLHKLKCSRLSAILIQNEGNVSQIEGESGQDLDSIVSILSSHVNQMAGPSTVNSTPAELQQQNSHLCTVCNRLWCKDNLSKEVTNINNINGAVICSTCEVALDQQRPADEQLEAGQAFTKNFIEVEVPSRNDDDASLLIPVVKLEYESDGDDNTESQIAVVNEKEPDDHGPWMIEQSLSTNIETASYSVENQANLKVFKLSNLPFQLEKDQLDCPVCHETFPNFVSLNTHMNVHYQNYYICDSCGKGFAKKTRLKSHLRTHRAGVFPCEFCDAVFDNMINKENHVSKEHESGDVKCNICNMSLPSFFESQKHLVEVHNEMVKRYKCKACTKSYITPSHLSSHVRRDHLNERTTSVLNAT